MFRSTVAIAAAAYVLASPPGVAAEQVEGTAMLVMEDFFVHDMQDDHSGEQSGHSDDGHHHEGTAVGYMLLGLDNGTTVVIADVNPAATQFRTEDRIALSISPKTQVAGTAQTCASPSAAICGQQQWKIDRVNRRVRREEVHRTRARRASVGADGSRSMIMIRMIYQDEDPADYCDDECIRRNAWTGTQNSAGMFQESSYGKMSFPTGQVISVRINKRVSSLSGCPFWDMGIDADNAARSQVGVNPDNYVHRSYYIPRNTPGCGWGGVAYVGCSVTHCKSWIRSNNGPVLAHELGHNLGLQHAGLDQDNSGSVDAGVYGQYGDHSGIMGNSGLWRGVNAPHRQQLNWVTSDVLQLSSCSARTVRFSSLYYSPGQRSGYSLVTLPRSGGGTWKISLRTALGYDSTMPTGFVNKIQVNYETSTSQPSLHVKALSAGETFSGSGITIKAASIATDFACVDFCGGDGSCSGGGGGGGGGGDPPPPPPPPPGNCQNDASVGDSTCTAWSNAGYCQRSSQYFDYVSGKCPKTCGTCTSATTTTVAPPPPPPPPGTPPPPPPPPGGGGGGGGDCNDASASCSAWANAGYCASSSQYYDYVSSNCPRTCGVCGGGGGGEVTTTTQPDNCEDNQNACTSWKNAGYCSTTSQYHDYVTGQCPKSCGACGGGGTTRATTTTSSNGGGGGGGDCTDASSSCNAWANAGYCSSTSRYSTYVNGRCPKACGNCGGNGGGDGTSATTTTVATTTTTAGSGNCQNDASIGDSTCAAWSNAGYCQRSSQYFDYVSGKCPRTCGTCESSSTTAATTTTTTPSEELVIRAVSPAGLTLDDDQVSVTYFYRVNTAGLSVELTARSADGREVGRDTVEATVTQLNGDRTRSLSINLAGLRVGDSVQISGVIMAGSSARVTGNTVTARIESSTECEDENANCGHWGMEGHCTRNLYVNYMKHRCKRTCGLCATQSAIASPPRETTTAASATGVEVAYLIKTEHSAGDSSRSSCAALGWIPRFGNTEVCGESDSGLAGCQVSVDHQYAQDLCASSGARLCSPNELGADVARGTGCGLDSGLVWTYEACARESTATSEAVVGFTAVLGRGKGGSHDGAVCLPAASTDAGVRCCADVAGDENATPPVIIDNFEDNYGDVDQAESMFQQPPAKPDDVAPELPRPDLPMPPVPPMPVEDTGSESDNPDDSAELEQRTSGNGGNDSSAGTSNDGSGGLSAGAIAALTVVALAALALVGIAIAVSTRRRAHGESPALGKVVEPFEDNKSESIHALEAGMLPLPNPTAVDSLHGTSRAEPAADPAVAADVDRRGSAGSFEENVFQLTGETVRVISVNRKNPVFADSHPSTLPEESNCDGPPELR